MKSLKVKSIVIVIIATLFSNITFAQDNSKLEYTDKAEFFEGQKTRALKINTVGTLLGLFKLTYEQMIQPGRNLELKDTYHGSSLTGSIGYKFVTIQNREARVENREARVENREGFVVKIEMSCQI